MKLTIVAFITYVALVAGDMYLHNPRGSNNRLNADGQARANANRLFDSQNNGNGGYNVGEVDTTVSSVENGKFRMHYFQSGKNYKTQVDGKGQSRFTVEWTNQHGCSDKDLHCNIVFQYLCQPDETETPPHTIRNGYSTSTPTYSYLADYTDRATKDSYVNSDNTALYYGVNEPWEWYDKCNKRNRHKGLFTADQQLSGTASIYTRQNAAGTRFGYECPEERDYYPYWHPSDWIDIVVFTDNTSRCDYYKTESFNVQSKGECLESYKSTPFGLKHYSTYNNKIDCESNNGNWVPFNNYLEVNPQYTTKQACTKASTKANPLFWGIPYRSADIDNMKLKNKDVDSLHRCLFALAQPDCKKAPKTRSNHLGNINTVTTARYTWVLPHFPSGKAQRCIFRARYNISTYDYDPLNTFSNQNQNANTGITSPVTNNPTIQISDAQIPFQLAINTAQFGRTFQDRSHVFKLIARPTSIKDDEIIHNINVRGKRGNIVQVYPAVEYDFVPKRLEIPSGDLVHFQWTGSNSNPAGNAGQGAAGTDRTNLVEMEGAGINYPVTSEKVNHMLPNADIVWSSSPQTKTKQDLIISMASSGYYSGMALCYASPKKEDINVLLDNAAPSYRGMVLRISPGSYYYMCTRNNAFTNRSQKARLRVTGNSTSTARKRFLQYISR